MLQQLINLNPDLQRLQDEGYDVYITAGYLVVKDVPYVNARQEVKRGKLISALDMSGDRTVKPSTHVTLFVGEHPCHRDGTEIAQIKHSSPEQKINDDITTQHMFSNKPTDGYKDYHEKMTTYVAIISHPAASIDPKVTAQTYPVIESDPADDSPFHYIDTASSRANIVAVTRKLKLSKIAVVGLGGTGSYVLDLVAKTPVKEIHLFDGDKFLQHNAFRAPGAPSITELRRIPKKVGYFRGRYSKMHRGIIAHPYVLDASNATELEGMDFVFMCIDGDEHKQNLLEKLEEMNIPFVDTGMGVQLTDDSLLGHIRLTTSTPRKRDHVRSRIGFTDDGENEYSRNIQIADLNALNAAFAVIKWKKIFGFYRDPEDEHHSIYELEGNIILNEKFQ